MRASDRSYTALRDEIVDGTLAPGAVLGEVEQAGRLGVSRTPIREAFSRLIADGLATPQSPRVLVVADLSAERVRDLYELRAALEGAAAAAAARRRDPEVFARLRTELAGAGRLVDEGEAGMLRYYDLVDRLDEAITEAADNDYLAGALASVRLHSARVRRLARHDAARLRRAADEHALVVDAILEGDAQLAAEATRVHLRHSLASALDRIPSSSAPLDAPRPGA